MDDRLLALRDLPDIRCGGQLEDIFTGPLGWSLASVNDQGELLPGCRIASGGVTLPRFTTHD
jgi:hypothetical protein